MIGLFTAALAAAFVCQMDRQVVVNAVPGGDWGVGNNVIAAADRPNWRFQLSRKGADKFLVKADADIMNIAGEWTAVSLAPGQFAFATATAPCTFTEQLCTALVQVSESGPGKAFVTVTVAGSAKVEGRDLRDHLQLMILGTCTVPDAKAKP